MTLFVRQPQRSTRMKHDSGTRADQASTPRTEPRPLTRSERIADAWVHRLAIVAAAAGVVVLMAVAVPQGSPALTFSLLVYGASLLVMLTSSALYNGGVASKNKDLLRRIDHAAIFVMIAGTYTPFVVMKLSGAWGRWLLVYVWAVAGLGVIVKLVWINRFTRLSLILYLFLGWTIVVAIKPLWSSFSLPAIVLLAAGGVLYSIGVVFHLWERLPYQQPIWHALVVAAAVCHYVAVIGEVALPGTLTCEEEGAKRRDWFIFAVAVLVIPATSVSAAQPSFDCLRAAAPIEQLICSDPQLLTLDGALGDAFAAYRQRLPEKDRAGALAEQRTWLALRLKQCEVPTKGGAELALEVRWRAAPCLDEMYRSRLAALGAQAEPRPTPLPQLAEPGFIHPNCLWPIIDQDPEETKAPRIPLEACARGNRHIPVSAGDEGSFSAQGAVEGFPTWLSYKLLGKLQDGRDIGIVWYNSGGTGQFSELYLLRRAPTDGLRELVLTGELIGGGGDRCNGGIEEAKLSDGPALEVTYNVTALDLLSEADEEVAEQAFEGLLSCAICCVGTVRRRLDLASKKETTLSATLTQFLDDDVATGGSKSVQACFDALARKAAGSLPHTFSPAEINALAQSFAKNCLKK